MNGLHLTNIEQVSISVDEKPDCAIFVEGRIKHKIAPASEVVVLPGFIPLVEHTASESAAQTEKSCPGRAVASVRLTGVSLVGIV
jgi:hypothetical protein